MHAADADVVETIKFTDRPLASPLRGRRASGLPECVRQQHCRREHVLLSDGRPEIVYAPAAPEISRSSPAFSGHDSNNSSVNPSSASATASSASTWPPGPRTSSRRQPSLSTKPWNPVSSSVALCSMFSFASLSGIARGDHASALTAMFRQTCNNGPAAAEAEAESSSELRGRGSFEPDARATS